MTTHNRVPPTKQWTAESLFTHLNSFMNRHSRDEWMKENLTFSDAIRIILEQCDRMTKIIGDALGCPEADHERYYSSLGRIVLLVGNTGCGSTTLMHTLAGEQWSQEETEYSMWKNGRSDDRLKPTTDIVQASIDHGNIITKTLVPNVRKVHPCGMEDQVDPWWIIDFPGVSATQGPLFQIAQ